MLVVPIREGEELAGVLEVFGADPEEFVESDQNLLEIFAREVSRIRRAALELDQRPAGPIQKPEALMLTGAAPQQKTRAPYEIWTMILASLTILLTIALSFMIGSRLGGLGLRSPGGRIQARPPSPASAAAPAPESGSVRKPAGGSESATKSPDPNAGGLVVYDQGKVVFRMKPSAPRRTAAPAAQGAEADTPAGMARVWLAADLAESRLVHRVEPQYPADALAAHRSGDVILEVLVGEDGAVASLRAVSGDPLLSAAAADAVRNWRYEPYRVRGQPAEFQTDVTLKFSLPD